MIFFLLIKNNPNDRAAKFMLHNLAQPALTFVCFWAATLLIMKSRAVRRQLVDPERELELIPLDIGMQITSSNVDEFLAHLNRLPAERQDSILPRRIRGALEYFKFRNSVPEVQSYLSTQAEIDASGVRRGYTLLRAFIWVCPILGFVGTVIGISEAIGGLSTSMQPVASAASEDFAAAKDDDLTKMKEGMRKVTNGLATAFDATLYGLVATIFLLFPTELLRKTEYATLDKIEVYANESLLRRMSEVGVSLDKDPAGYAREALQGAFQQHQQWLAQWQDQVSRLGQTIGGKFEVSLREVVQKLTQDEVSRLERMGQLARSLDGILGEARGAVGAVSKASGQSANEAQRVVEAIGQAVERMTRSCKSWSESLISSRGSPARTHAEAFATRLTPSGSTFRAWPNETLILPTPVRGSSPNPHRSWIWTHNHPTLQAGDGVGSARILRDPKTRDSEYRPWHADAVSWSYRCSRS